LPILKKKAAIACLKSNNRQEICADTFSTFYTLFIQYGASHEIIVINRRSRYSHITRYRGRMCLVG
jgi:hypothetical protein